MLLSFISNMLAKTHASFWLPNDSPLPVTGTTFTVFLYTFISFVNVREKNVNIRKEEIVS